MISLCQKCIKTKTGFTCSTCGPFAKSKERIQKFKEMGDKSYISKNPKYDGYQRGIASMFYKILIISQKEAVLIHC